jgi:hypothetical protein
MWQLALPRALLQGPAPRVGKIIKKSDAEGILIAWPDGGSSWMARAVFCTVQHPHFKIVLVDEALISGVIGSDTAAAAAATATAAVDKRPKFRLNISHSAHGGKFSGGSGSIADGGTQASGAVTADTAPLLIARVAVAPLCPLAAPPGASALGQRLPTLHTIRKGGLIGENCLCCPPEDSEGEEEDQAGLGDFGEGRAVGGIRRRLDQMELDGAGHIE